MNAPEVFAVEAAALLGFRAAVLMAVKSFKAERGLLDEPSVVERPEARLFFGVPNSWLGIAFYTLVIVLVPFENIVPSAKHLLVAVAAFAAVTSVVLAWHLIRKNLSCPRCWTSHAANLLIFAVAVRNF